MTIENFHALGLHDMLLRSLNRMQFLKPTEIQAKTIPAALEGRDLIATSQTGTGKTIAYSVPVISYLYNASPDQLKRTALILTPTRELAQQAYDSLKAILERKMNVDMALLIGGQPMFKQYSQLKRRPTLIIGTPGRINDHLLRGSLKLTYAGFLVLDEFDRMLDMGFEEQLEEITRYLPKERQTLMFSATMAPDILRKAERYLQEPLRISVGSTRTPVEKIKQEVLRISESEKYPTLMKHLNQNSGSSIIVFVKTKIRADEVARRLRENGQRVDAIHGDLRQRNRDRVIRDFRDGRIKVLVGTDVAARGLDIPGVEWVINFDLPQRAEDYIHRIGRTGRAGAEGQAISYVTKQDGLRWRDICELIDPTQKEKRRDFHPRQQQGGQKRSYGHKPRSRSHHDGPQRYRQGRPKAAGGRRG